MSPFFTKRKFLALPPEQQHKKCAELLRAIYSKLLTGEEFDADLARYRDLAEWCGWPVPEKPTRKEIADLYHRHSLQSKRGCKEHHLLPNIRKGDKSEALPPLNVAVYLDNIRSAHNVGSILRTVEAFSLGEVHFSTATPFATHKQVQDASMGASEWVKCHPEAELKLLPRPIIVLETSEEAVPLHEFPFPETFTLVVGNEEYGCSDETLKLADAIVEIPLRGRKNSLNVANAFAIAAAEIIKQNELRT